MSLDGDGVCSVVIVIAVPRVAGFMFGAYANPISLPVAAAHNQHESFLNPNQGSMQYSRRSSTTFPIRSPVISPSFFYYHRYGGWF